MGDYWNDRFRVQGQIWGTVPSPTALAAAAIFREAGVRRVLVPGARPFFSEEDLLEHFSSFAILSTGQVDEVLQYGDHGAKKQYRLRTVTARKPV